MFKTDIKERKVALLIQAPGGNKKGAKFYPAGLLAVGKILQDHGMRVKIVDLCLDGTEELIKIAGEINPDLIGFGGIAPSYGSVNEISRLLYKYCPNSVYIAGGPLASTFELLLEDGIISYVFHGEVERSLPKFIKFLEGKNGLQDIGGISFLKNRLTSFGIKSESKRWHMESDLFCRAFPERQLENLDEIGIQDFTLVNPDSYVADLKDWYIAYKPDIDEIKALKTRIQDIVNKRKTRYFEINASRGCTHRCTFCYRHMKGVRRHSVTYIIEAIRELKRCCEIDGILFTDELFNNDLTWIYNLCDALDNSGLGLSFYMVGGMRADKIDENLINRMVKSGFIWIVMGQESGSDTVLKYYGKGVTRQENIDATTLIKRCGIYPSVQLVIGSPAETTKTVLETCDFLKAIDARGVSINYLVPLPETPIWDYVIKKGYITDKRSYLNRVKKCGPNFTLGLNLSKANKLMWIFWRTLLKRAVCLNQYRTNFFMKIYFKSFLFLFEGGVKKIFSLSALIVKNKKGGPGRG